MPTLVQLSDLHFGPDHNSKLDGILLSEIAALHPDAVIVSGDFTMRARHREFEQARDFLSQIKTPTLTIPGNHDQPILPIADSIERFTHQYARYGKYIHNGTDSVLQINGVFAVGLNDNHPIVPGGFWSRQQRVWLSEQLSRAPRDAIKVVASHHHFVWGSKLKPAGFWNAESALGFLARNGVELVLNGHTHVAHAEQTASGVVVTRAGTATSNRLRHGNQNAYNLINVDERQIAVFVRQYDERAHAFGSARAYTFPRKNK